MPNYERIPTHNNDSGRSRTVVTWTEKAGRIVLFGCSVVCNVFLQGSSAVITASAFAAMTLTTSATDIARFVRDKDKLRTRDKFSLPISWALATFSTIGYIIFTVKAPALSGPETAAISAVINLVAALPTATIPQLTTLLLDKHEGRNVAARVPVSAEGENEQGETVLRLISADKEDPFAAQRDIFTKKVRSAIKEAATHFDLLAQENGRLKLLIKCKNLLEESESDEILIVKRKELKQQATEILQTLHIPQETNIIFLIENQEQKISSVTDKLAIKYQDLASYSEQIDRERLGMVGLAQEIERFMGNAPISQPESTAPQAEIAAQAPTGSAPLQAYSGRFFTVNPSHHEAIGDNDDKPLIQHNNT